MQAKSLAAAVVAGLVLAGCGGDAADQSNQTARSAERPAAMPSSADAGRGDTMRPAERASSPAEQDSKRPQAPASAKGNEPKAAGAGPKTAEGHGPKRKVTARHVLRALAPSDDAANAQASRDPTSKKLWALVQPRLGKARTVAPAQAAPSTEALRKLIRAAQRRPGD